MYTEGNRQPGNRASLSSERVCCMCLAESDVCRRVTHELRGLDVTPWNVITGFGDCRNNDVSDHAMRM